ncbi:pantothenate synthetase [Polaribacter pacificus]|uniref:Pantothenate synthetase n=1 Tax=Polaribacter pacificus TaxID=1775173 RepID=A0A917HVR1_9FLAO|nr:pantoate--beta-alanine ligase [Polaribacter pacificus]GGG92732.1 pantothenate synthetase [Polaribacter pacificus]
MQVFKKKNALKDCLSEFKANNYHVGFVPTMGALHEGHLSLISHSKKNNDITVVSIFVNPTQFDNTEDLEKYPKTLEEDLALLEKANCDIVFIPDAKEMYSDNIVSGTYSFDGLENQMEGKYRSGHFDGVATIVHAFFDLIKPTNAYFGEKDFQQLQIVKKLAEKKNLPLNVIGCPIFREKDGLAMSSRNVRLNPEQRAAAPFIYKLLKKVVLQAKKNTIEEISRQVEKEFETNELLNLEYFAIAEEDSLASPKEIDLSKKNRAFIAVHAGNIRLIDNISLS